MGYLERNSETLKTPGFSGFDSRVSGFSRVVIFGFGSGSGSKKVGLFPRVSGFRVQRPITSQGVTFVTSQTQICTMVNFVVEELTIYFILGHFVLSRITKISFLNFCCTT